MTDPPGFLGHCVQLARLGGMAEAAALLDRAPLGFPEDGRLWRSIGMFRHRTGNHAGGCAALETARLPAPLDHRSRSALAECFARTGHPSLAGNLDRDLASDPRCPEECLLAVGQDHGPEGCPLGADGHP